MRLRKVRSFARLSPIGSGESHGLPWGLCPQVDSSTTFYPVNVAHAPLTRPGRWGSSYCYVRTEAREADSLPEDSRVRTANEHQHPGVWGPARRSSVSSPCPSVDLPQEQAELGQLPQTPLGPAAPRVHVFYQTRRGKDPWATCPRPATRGSHITDLPLSSRCRSVPCDIPRADLAPPKARGGRWGP